jgi:hypothetical protein
MAWRDASGAATAARWLLYTDAAVSAVAIPVSQAGKGNMLADVRPVFGLAEMLVYFATGILVLRWLYLASTNARALGADDMMVSPGWAVGWYFVPLMNYVMPFVAMRELWRASARPKDWQAAPTPPSLPFWWGCWVIAIILGGVSFRLLWEEDEAMRIASDGFAAASDLFMVPSALLLAWIVGRIQAMQVAARPAAAF